jgi:hypothetical protein
MQQAQAYQPPNAGKAAFLNGLYFGLGAVVLNFVVLLVPDLLGLRIPGLLLVVLSWLIGLTAFFLAGMFAAKKTGRVGTGTLAGLWAGMFNGVLTNALYGLIVMVFLSLDNGSLYHELLSSLASSSASGALLSPAQADTIVRSAMIMGLSFFVLFDIGVGAGLGPLGGLIGRSMSKIPREPSQPMPYYPPYGPPPFPGQPPYPGQQ